MRSASIIELVDTIINSKGYQNFIKFCDSHYQDIDGIESIRNYISENNICPDCDFVDNGCNRVVFKYVNSNPQNDVLIKIDLTENGGNYKEIDLINYLRMNKADYLIDYLNEPIYLKDRIQVCSVVNPLESYNKDGVERILSDFKEEGILLDDIEDRACNIGIKDGNLILLDFELWVKLNTNRKPRKIKNF